MNEKDPVIISESLETSQIYRSLAKIFRARVGTNTPRHSIIFPKNSIAFLVQPVCELSATWPPQGKYFLDNTLMERFEEDKVVFFLCDGASSCVDNILNILQPPNEVKAKVYEVKKLLSGSMLESDVFQMLEKNLEISQHDAMVLKDGCCTLANVSCSTVEQLKDCSLSQNTAKQVYDFFHNPPGTNSPRGSWNCVI